MARVNILMSLEGADELKRKLRKLEPQFLDAMKQELPREGESLRSAAQSLAPVAGGELRSSAVVATKVSKTRVAVLVGYTDEKAAAVHEGIHWGRFHPGTKGYKWLERALNTFAAGFTNRIAGVLRGVVSRGGK